MASVFQQIFQAQAQMQTLLMTLPNVIGVAAGYKESGGVRTTQPALVVLVQQKKPLDGLAQSQRIPDEISGIPTDVYEVGYVRAQQHTERFRPVIPGAASIGHYKVTAGTLGSMVRDRTTNERFILSNNHVLANSNEALIGDDILQPGATDGGQRPADVVAKLERFITLNYIEGEVGSQPEEPTPNPGGTSSGCDVVDVLVGLSNLLASISGSEKRVAATSAQTVIAQPGKDNVVDAALARPLDQQMFSDQILDIGTIRETTNPELDMQVRKSGRTTGLTQSKITLLNATINVAYSTSQGDRTARFTGQVICDPMSAGGDSGSLVVSDNKAVGLLFAGSPLATIFTPISTVMNALNIRFEVE